MRVATWFAIAALAACGGGDDGPGDPDGAAAIDAPPGSDGDVDGPGLALCQRGGHLFCEDFEALPLGPAVSSAWTTESQNGGLTIDGTHARGQRALRVATTGNGRARLQVANLAPPLNSLYGRMDAWVTAFPTAPNYAHFTLVEAAGTTNATLLRPIGGQFVPAADAGGAGANSYWGVGSDGGPTGDWTNWRTTAPAEAGRWLCLEFQLDSPTGAMNVWIDGTPRPELSVTRTMHGGTQVDLVFPTIDRIWFGWWLYQGGTTPAGFELWLDQLALSPTRIGCD